MDSGFNQNQSELGIAILAVTFQMLADRDSLLDQLVQVFWDFRGKTAGLEDSQNLVSGDESNLGDTVRVTEDDTDLGWAQTLFGELADGFANFLWASLQPAWWSSAVRQSRG